MGVNTELKNLLKRFSFPRLEVSESISKNITEGKPACLENERMYLKMGDEFRNAKSWTLAARVPWRYTQNPQDSVLSCSELQNNIETLNNWFSRWRVLASSCFLFLGHLLVLPLDKG